MTEEGKKLIRILKQLKEEGVEEGYSTIAEILDITINRLDELVKENEKLKEIITEYNKNNLSASLGIRFNEIFTKEKK